MREGLSDSLSAFQDETKARWKFYACLREEVREKKVGTTFTSFTLGIVYSCLSRSSFENFMYFTIHSCHKSLRYRYVSGT